MTREMVEWIEGQPLGKQQDGQEEIWTYNGGVPGYAIIFVNGKVVRIEAGELP